MKDKEQDYSCHSSDNSIIFKLPVPHSVNRSFIVARGRIIKSKHARGFDEEVSKFIQVNNHFCSQARSLAQAWVTQGYLLSVDTIFYFKRQRLFTVSKSAKFTVKALDLNNRIKPLMDAVSLICGVDDRYFFQHFFEKKVLTSDKLDEFCEVTISQVT